MARKSKSQQGVCVSLPWRTELVFESHKDGSKKIRFIRSIRLHRHLPVPIVMHAGCPSRRSGRVAHAAGMEQCTSHFKPIIVVDHRNTNLPIILHAGCPCR